MLRHAVVAIDNLPISTEGTLAKVRPLRWIWIGEIFGQAILWQPLFRGQPDFGHLVAKVDVNVSPDPVQDVLLVDCMLSHFHRLHLYQGGASLVVKDLDSLHDTKSKSDRLNINRVQVEKKRQKPRTP